MTTLRALCRCLRYIIAGVLVAAMVIPSQVFALDINVTAEVPVPVPPEIIDATVIFSGFSYPNSAMRILKDGTQVVTGAADAQGRYTITVTTAPGAYTFGVIGKDIRGRDGAVTNFSLALTSGATVTISDVFLAPTIATNATSVTAGETVAFSGFTVPQSTVTLTVNSFQEKIYTATSNSAGEWLINVATSTFEAGTHTASAKSTTGTLASEISGIVSFIVKGAQPPNKCDGKVSGDINCDGKVDLIDFSIMLYYWNVTHPANARVDINADGVVDEADFSILLFYWTG